MLSLATAVAAGGAVFFGAGYSLFSIASLVLALSVVAIGSWRIAGLGPDEPLDVRIIDATILAFAYLALAGLLLGSLGILAWWSLLVLTAVAGLVASRAHGRLASAGMDAGSGVLGWQGFATSLALALASFAIIQSVLGRILRPPIGDPLAYHLPFAVEWLQSGTLGMPVPPAGDPSPPFYPLNSSLWMFWLLSPIESEILARFVQLPFLLLLGLATFRLARELKLPVPLAAMTGALAVSVPDIARSASLPENDLMLAALLVTVTAFLARLWRSYSDWRAVLTALTVGLAIGTKVIALAYGALLGLLWLVLVLRKGAADGWRRAGSMAALGVGVVIVAGGYSYLRNLVVMDNPLYPAGYALAGRTVLDGLYFPTWEWRQNHAFFPFDWRDFLFGSRRIFGLTVTVWALPGFLLAAVALACEKLRRETPSRDLLPRFALLLCVPISLAIYWFIIPYHFDRFLFAPVVWGSVLAMWALNWWWVRLGKGHWPALPAYLAVPVIVFNLLNIPLDPAVRERAIYWIAAAIVVGGVLGALWLIRRIASTRIGSLAAASALGIAALAAVLFPIWNREYEQRRFDEWHLQIQGFNQQTDAWEWLAARTGGAPSTIAVIGTNEVFPLYGQDLDNRLVTIWHSGEVAAFGWDTPFVLYGEPDQAAWTDQVASFGVNFLVVTENVSFGGWPIEREWMQAEGNRFQLVFQNDDIEIYEVLVSPATGSAILVGMDGSFSSIGSDIDKHG